jgi:DNA-binding transcriptional LysR family regulator
LKQGWAFACWSHDAIDTALRFGDPPENLIARRVADMRVITAASPNYIARRGRTSHPSELIDHETIDFWDPSKGRAYDWEFRHNTEVLPVKTRARLMTSDAATMLASCLAGVGICQLPLLARTTSSRGGSLSICSLIGRVRELARFV